MAYDELFEHLNSLKRDDCYRVDAVMKKSPYEVTEKVYFVGVNGSEQGPYVRKRIVLDSSMGSAYESIFEAQNAGRRFAYLPRIIECYSTGEERIVVMEYVQGETLQDVVYRCDPSVALAVDLFPRICAAVRELHGSFAPPLIHRDLKPSNIMVARDSLTIIDFGIARTYKAHAETDTKHFGTKAYAPPEQFGFGQTDERSDVYALGMLLYFCLTEKTPDARARKGSFRSPQIPERFRRIIEKAVELDPKDRYQTVEALMAAFGGVSGPAAQSSVGWTLRNDGCLQGASIEASNEMLTAPPMPVLQEKPSVLSRVSKSLGVAWNIALLILLTILAAASIVATISPNPTSAIAGYSFLRRAVSYGAVVLFLFVPLAYRVSYKRPIKKYVPILRDFTSEKDTALLVVCFVILFIGFGFVAPAL